MYFLRMGIVSRAREPMIPRRGSAKRVQICNVIRRGQMPARCPKELEN